VAIRVSDTCKEVVDAMVRRTVPRDSLADARGPWHFSRDALVKAMEQAAHKEHEVSTMVDLCRAAQLRVRILLSE
jgi:2-C-methyl-D-erythritol 4-phosphate cytidylyltransferase